MKYLTFTLTHDGNDYHVVCWPLPSRRCLVQMNPNGKKNNHIVIFNATIPEVLGYLDEQGIKHPSLEQIVAMFN